MDINEVKNVIRGLPEHLAVMLHGPPGIGKTWGIHELAEETGAKCHVFLACTMDPTDITGIPMKTEQGFTEFAPPLWVYELSTESPYQGPAIAFFDDLPTADEYVQASFFRLVHERRAGKFQFRDNVRIIAAGNRKEDKAAVRGMPTPLRNRFIHFTVDTNTPNWVKWALRKGLNPTPIAFIRKFEQHLNSYDPKKDENAFATPRSWHMLSDCLNAIDNVSFEIIAACIGEGVAREYFAFSKVKDKLLSPVEILKNPETVEICKEIDVLYATETSLASHISSNPVKEKIIQGLKYSIREEMPKEFGVILASDLHDIFINSDSLTEEDKQAIFSHPVHGKLSEKFEEFCL